MKLPSRSRPHAEIFTGAMADVSFLLVIFFMVTSAFTVFWGLDLALPSDTPEAETVDYVASIDILVHSDGTLDVDRQTMGREELLAYVGDRLRANPLKPVILRAEAATRYGDFVAILDLLRAAPEQAGFAVANLAIPTFREMQQLWQPS